MSDTVARMEPRERAQEAEGDVMFLLLNPLLEPKVLGVLGSSEHTKGDKWERGLKTKEGQNLLQEVLARSSSSKSSRRGDALGQRNRDRLRDVGFIEPKEEEEESEEEPIFAMQSPKSKAPPPHRIKAELDEPPDRYAKRLKAVKPENSDSDEASAPSAAEVARPSRSFYA